MTSSSKRRRMLIILGCVVLCVVPVLAIFFISRGAAPAAVVPPASPAPALGSVPVAITSDVVGARTQVTAADLAVVLRAPADLPAPGMYFSSVADLTKSPHFSIVALAANTVVQPDMLAATADGAKAAVKPPLVSLPAGMVAISIPFDEARGAGGFIQAGDRFDIAVDVTGNGSIRYLFQDILVLKTGSLSQQGQTASPTLLLVELDRAKAEELLFVLNGKGTPATIVRYVLRSQLDYGKGDVKTPAHAAPAAGDPALSPNDLAQLFAR